MGLFMHKSSAVEVDHGSAIVGHDPPVLKELETEWLHFPPHREALGTRTEGLTVV